MPRTAALAFLCAVGLLGCDRQPAPPTPGIVTEDDDAPEEKFPTVIPPDDGTYHPTTVGAKWVYQTTYARGSISIRTYVATQVENRNGAKLVSVGRVKKNGDVAPHAMTRVAPEGLYSLVDLPGKPNAPLLYLKLPHKDGNTWNGYAEGGEPALTAYGPEEVKVPAGIFKAIRVVRGTGTIHKDTEWYAPGVGVVKAESDSPWPPEDPAGKSETVLKAFRPGKE
jgi:hypothetical protein